MKTTNWQRIRIEQGKRLRTGLRWRRWDVERLAVEANVPAGSLRAHMEGTHSLAADELLAIGEVLDLPVWLLFEV